MKEEKTGFIYIWYDRKRKMYYIGCHWGTIDDGYICSSNRMRDAYRRRPKDFKRRIIQKNIPHEELLREEYKWLNKIRNDELGKKYYNLSNRHFGHWIYDTEKTLSIKSKISKKLKGKKQSDETIRKRVEGRRGYKPTAEHKQKISKTIKKWHLKRKMRRC